MPPTPSPSSSYLDLPCLRKRNLPSAELTSSGPNETMDPFFLDGTPCRDDVVSGHLCNPEGPALNSLDCVSLKSV